MINELLRVVFKVLFFAIRFVLNLILLPIRPLMYAFPDFTNFLNYAGDFIDNYLLKGVAFAREIFFNLTGFPQALLTLSINFFMGVLAFIGTIRLVKFVQNAYRTFKGGKQS